MLIQLARTVVEMLSWLWWMALFNASNLVMPSTPRGLLYHSRWENVKSRYHVESFANLDCCEIYLNSRYKRFEWFLWSRSWILYNWIIMWRSNQMKFSIKQFVQFTEMLVRMDIGIARIVGFFLQLNSIPLFPLIECFNLIPTFIIIS